MSPFGPEEASCHRDLHGFRTEQLFCRNHLKHLKVVQQYRMFVIRAKVLVLTNLVNAKHRM